MPRNGHDDASAQELGILLHEFITAPTLTAKQRIVEGNRERLLSTAADSALAALLLEYDERDESVRASLELHRDLLARCRTEGIPEAFAALRREIEDEQRLDAMTAEEAQALVNTIGEFITTPSWEDARTYLREHPELLTARTEAVFQRLIETHTRRGDQEVVRRLTIHRDLLLTVREMGEEAAFGRMANPPDALDVIVENTVHVLTGRRDARAHWLERVQMAGVRAAELGDEPMRRLLEAVSQLLQGASTEEAAPDVQHAHLAAWQRIVASLDATEPPEAPDTTRTP